MIRVVLCDDHGLIRRGIRDTPADGGDIQIVGEAGDYGELRTVLRALGEERLRCAGARHQHARPQRPRCCTRCAIKARPSAP